MNKRKFFLFTLFFAVISMLPAVCYSNRISGKPAIMKKAVKLHLPFIENRGQLNDKKVRFYAKTFAGSVYVTGKGEMIYCFSGMENTDNKSALDKKGRKEKISDIAMFKEVLVGAKNAGAEGLNKAETKINYFTGKDKSKWKRNISAYDEITFGEIYNNVELKLRAYGDNVEKIFTVNPGGKTEDIKISFEGIKGLRINDSGELEVTTQSGEVKFTKPYAYQEVDGKRIEIKSCFRTGNIMPQVSAVKYYGFSVAPYNKNYPLIIDPAFVYTHIGGARNDNVAFVTVGKDGYIYVAGNSNSAEFPVTTGSYQPDRGGKYDAFVLKLTPDLTSLVQSTFIGGSDSDYAISIAIDSGGNIYVAGYTSSTDFPGTTGGAQASHGNGDIDTFVSKLDSDLTTLIQSTYIGGSGNHNDPFSMAIDSSGDIYIAGWTNSSDLPGTADGAQTAYGGGKYDAFISKLSSDLTTFIRSTYIGSSDFDKITSIAIDSEGNVYGAGITASTDFPGVSKSSSQPAHGGGEMDAFVSKHSSDLKTLIQSTYLGGSGNPSDDAKFVTIDSEGNILVSGHTASEDFPGVKDGAQPSYGGGDYDAFISKLSPDLKTLIQSTYLGGSGDSDDAYSLSMDSTGNIYVAGQATSTNFPGTSGGVQSSYGGGDFDAFVSKLSSNLKTLIQSTHFGGSGNDFGLSVAIDTQGNIFMAGYTGSTDLSVPEGTLQSSYGGGDNDGFVLKLDGSLKTDKKADILSKKILVPKKIKKGKKIKIKCIVKNAGETSASASMTDFYLSTNSKKTISKKDKAIRSKKVKSLENKSTARVVLKWKIPKKLKNGKYYVKSFCDSKEKIDESNEQNNIGVSKKITVN